MRRFSSALRYRRLVLRDAQVRVEGNADPTLLLSGSPKVNAVCERVSGKILLRRILPMQCLSAQLMIGTRIQMNRRPFGSQ